MKVYDYLLNKEFGDLVVESYNIEISTQQQRKVWNCRCKLCGNIKPIQERYLLAGKRDCGCRSGEKIGKANSEKYINKRLEEANALVGTKTKLGSEILRLVVKPDRGVEAIFEVKCAKCGEIYRAGIYGLTNNRHKLCPDCSVFCAGRKDSTDFSGIELDDFKVIRKIDNDLWECEKYGNKVIKTTKQVRKKVYDYRIKYNISINEVPREIKIPFRFVGE